MLIDDEGREMGIEKTTLKDPPYKKNPPFRPKEKERKKRGYSGDFDQYPYL